jgi:predicted nuclease with TOPRIM domain
VESSVDAKEQADLLVSGFQELVRLAAEIRDDLKQGQATLDQLEEKSKQRQALFTSVQMRWEELVATDHKLVMSEARTRIAELYSQLTQIDHEAGLLVEKLSADAFTRTQMAKTQRLAHQQYYNTTRGTSGLGFFIDKKNT